MTRTERSREFAARILEGLAKVAKPECPQCLGRGVIDVGRGDREDLIVCTCVAIEEKESE